MAIQVTNTSSQLSGKTLLDAEDTQTITGAKTFDLDPAAPFIVSSGSAVVTNLDADKVDGKHAAALLLLDGTQAMTGKLDLGTNGQIQFPASQNASAGANVLDDYEEGTWTPALKFGGAATGMTYSLQTGRYTKVGRQVTLECSITLTAKGSSTGAPTITGMPFNAGVTGAGVGTVDAAAGLSGLTAGLYVVADAAGNLYLFGNGTAGRVTLAETNFANNTSFTFTNTYFV